jgi:two-component system NtrC family sensor kinase
MEKTTFKIRRKVIQTFLFCVLAVLVFAVFSFQVHREIGHRLQLLEVTNDLFNNILEIRRFEKNFFLYQQPASLQEARSYGQRVAALYQGHEGEILGLQKGPQEPEFPKVLRRYQEVLEELQAGSKPGVSRLGSAEEALRNLGQELLNLTENWAREERLEIDRLFARAMYLFLFSVLAFVALGVLVAFYLARLFVRPLVKMQQAMDKIAQGDFTPLPAAVESQSEEFAALFQAFNRMMHELQEHQEQLVQSRKIAAIGTLTSGIAHELNNPINNIVLTAETLQEDFRTLPADEALGLIQDILGQSERAAEIVKGLLDFSRSEHPEFVSLSLADVIQDTLKLVRNQLVLSGIQVEEELPELPPVHGDRKGLQQVFLNLFINAIQAMPDGGTLQIRTSSADGHWLKVEVSDTGVGIDPKNLPRIFDPFFSTKQVGRGTGLGLSVTYGIIDKHGGHIEAHSQKGQGSTFTILLPLKEGSGNDAHRGGG